MLLSSTVFAWEGSSVKATSSISDFNIVFSNIAASGGTSTSPKTLSTKTVIGKNIDPGYSMIKLTDLQYLGAKAQVTGNNYYASINGQIIVFTKGSAEYNSTTHYIIDKPTGGTEEHYILGKGTTESEAKAQLINNVPYVRLTDAANQCGALIVTYNSTENAAYVFHFRVNGDNPYDDDNVYIVGGSWQDGWDSKGTINLSPNFKINELWAKNPTGTYQYQLKISVASLQTEENIRHYYNDDSSINVTSGFRSWVNNRNAGGDERSLHMRGRAIDATATDTKSLYNKVYDEFRGSNSNPISAGISWYSRVYGTAASISGAYDLEKMPHEGSWWVHLGVKPEFISGM